MTTSSLHFSMKQVSPHMVQSIVTAGTDLVTPIKNQMVDMYRDYRALPGYEHAALPASYTAKYFNKEITRDTEQFIFKHFVIDFLMSKLVENNVVVTNWPRLTEVVSNPDDESLTYSFLLSQPPELNLKEWKHFVFKQPQRKNYKDLDKQVASFLKEGVDLYRRMDKEVAEAGDWIHFQAQLLSKETGEPIVKSHAHNYWIRLTQESISNTLQASFFGHHLNDSFIIPALPFTSTVGSGAQEPCHYQITIKSITKGLHLCLDFFKNAFRLKTRADVHRKLIEVFSYRNDISQRRSIIEELFHLLFTKHRFEVPKHIITRKQEILLRSLRKKPDYHVYKSHKDFNRYVEALAEKILKEEIMIDNIAAAEGITVECTDIAAYLHLFNNERLKEFIYFKPLIDNIEETDTPLHEGMLIQAVRREKTLNYIIHTLS